MPHLFAFCGRIGQFNGSGIYFHLFRRNHVIYVTFVKYIGRKKAPCVTELHTHSGMSYSDVIWNAIAVRYKQYGQLMVAPKHNGEKITASINRSILSGSDNAGTKRHPQSN